MAKKKEIVVENIEENDLQNTVFEGSIDDICADDTEVENVFVEEAE